MILFVVLLGLAIPRLAYASQVEQAVPLMESDWTVLSYSKIPANEVVFADGLTVKVERSAGPIVHKLQDTIKITGFSAKGKISNVKKVESGAFDEDSQLRFGLVAVGKQTLSGPKRWFAADWVKKLFALAPKDAGLDKIYFYNLTNRPGMIGKSRVHPKSSLIVETIAAEPAKDGTFEFNRDFDQPVETAAIWISIDGDDSGSTYETHISEMKLRSLP